MIIPFVDVELVKADPTYFGALMSKALKDKLHLVSEGKCIQLKVSLYVFTQNFSTEVKS